MSQVTQVSQAILESIRYIGFVFLEKPVVALVLFQSTALQCCLVAEVVMLGLLEEEEGEPKKRKLNVVYNKNYMYFG